MGFEAETARWEQAGARLHEHLKQLAEARDLSTPPRKLLPYRSWSSWSKKALASYTPGDDD